MAKSDPPPPVVLAETFEATPSTSDPTFKFYQVAVPAFSFNQTGDQTGVTRTVPNVVGDSGSSFVRLGSFPDVTNPSMGPAGFAASLALAARVGDADGIATEVPDQSPSMVYGGDPEWLLGFADDTRVHKAEVQPGKRETAILLTKGGWWDHSDGNRVTTTAGDKIEIIQGNYKMVVMGRQQEPANMLVRDVSGGMVEENGPAPSCAVRTIEWVGDEGGTYSLYQNNGLGNVYTSFYGETGDLYAGPTKESWTGQAPDDFPKTPFYINSQAQRTAEGGPTTAVDTVITDYTWAASITTYTGSETKPIPLITEWAFAEEVVINNGSATEPHGSSTETTWIRVDTSTMTVLEDQTETLTVIGAKTETTTLGSSTETTTVTGTVTDVTTVGGAITEVTTVGGAITDVKTVGGAITEVTTVEGAITEVTLARLKTDVFLGIGVSAEIGAKLELFVGGRISIDLGAALEIAFPEKTHIEIPNKTEQRLDKIEASLSNVKTAMTYVTAATSVEWVAACIRLGL